ncbi:hypothetical protein [Bacteroides sp. 224]|uniref:hypothetical protein n=1 Tax=Bacteroides sp. 224 TaxID=2302936 RepID=UPI0013D47644|nr:hypothetical protein [Bacteroides sp. 224]
MKNSDFTSLNTDDELFKKRKGDNPAWWQFVKENSQKVFMWISARAILQISTIM